MKQAIVFLWIGFAGTNIIAQTNTFPSSGNVGIGTMSPANTLHVVGGVSAGDSKFYNSVQLTGSINGSTQSWIWAGATNQLHLGVGSVSSPNTKMVIDNTGNVGIGTTSPVAKLDINGSVQLPVSASITVGDTWNVGSLTWKNGVSTMGTASALNFFWTNGFSVGGSSTPSERGYYFSNGGWTGMYSPAADNIAWTIDNAEKMRINSSGNLGIGTNSPDAGAKLHVAGGVLASAAFSSTSGSTGGIDYYGGGLRIFSMGTNDSTKGTYTWIAKGADGSSSTPMIIDASGNLGIGTTVSLSEKLSVKGNVKAQKVIVTQTGWSDYVFTKDYRLRSLQDLETFINQYKHLPEVPTAMEVAAKGISVGDNQALLLKKIEELTLYMIGLNKKNDELIKRVQTLEKNIK